MAQQNQRAFRGEPVPVKLQPVEPEPFSLEAEPVPVKPEDVAPAKRPEEVEESISLVEPSGSQGTPTVQAMGASLTKADKLQFKRPVHLSQADATRCRIFHSRIALGPLDHMERSINEWVDSEDIGIKHVGHVIGVMEGKTAEPNLIVVVWY